MNYCCSSQLKLGRNNYGGAWMKYALPAAIGIFTAAVIFAGEKPQSVITKITLERTSCYGTCPSYQLTLDADGMVRYQGKDYVREKGRRTGQVTGKGLQQILKKIHEIRFFELQDKYNSLEINGSMLVVTDQPTTITSVTRAGRTKKVENYFGGPKGLYDLEQLIDEITRSSNWVGGQSRQNKDVPYYDSFPLHRVITFRALLEGSSEFHTGATSTPSKYSKYILMFVHNAMSFDLHALSSINLSQFDGYIVDATGTLEDNHKSQLIFNVSKIHPIRRYSDSE